MKLFFANSAFSFSRVLTLFTKSVILKIITLKQKLKKINNKYSPMPLKKFFLIILKLIRSSIPTLLKLYKLKPNPINPTAKNRRLAEFNGNTIPIKYEISTLYAK